MVHCQIQLVQDLPQDGLLKGGVGETTKCLSVTAPERGEEKHIKISLTASVDKKSTHCAWEGWHRVEPVCAKMHEDIDIGVIGMWGEKLIYGSIEKIKIRFTGMS